MPLSNAKFPLESARPPAAGIAGADTLADCQAQLQALARQQELLAYGISHDLRAPLRAIDQFSAMLQRHADAQLDDTGRGHLQRIREATARMGELIESLLELSHVDRVALAVAPVDLSLQAELVAAELQEAAPDRAAQVDVVTGLVAMGDEPQLRLLLRQLLRNAWQFSGPRGYVTSALVGIAGAFLGFRIAGLLGIFGALAGLIAAALGATVILFAWRAMR